MPARRRFRSAVAGGANRFAFAEGPRVHLWRDPALNQPPPFPLPTRDPAAPSRPLAGPA